MSTQAHSELHSQWGKVSGLVQQIKTTLLAPIVRIKKEWDGLNRFIDDAERVRDEQASIRKTLARFSSPVIAGKNRKLDTI